MCPEDSTLGPGSGPRTSEAWGHGTVSRRPWGGAAVAEQTELSVSLTARGQEGELGVNPVCQPPPREPKAPKHHFFFCFFF